MCMKRCCSWAGPTQAVTCGGDSLGSNAFCVAALLLCWPHEPVTRSLDIVWLVSPVKARVLLEHSPSCCPSPTGPARHQPLGDRHLGSWIASQASPNAALPYSMTYIVSLDRSGRCNRYFLRPGKPQEDPAAVTAVANLRS
jgi:hypothetical protein